MLLYRGLMPPMGREAWGQEETPPLVQSQLQARLRSRDSRNGFARRLKERRIVCGWSPTAGET